MRSHSWSGIGQKAGWIGRLRRPGSLFVEALRSPCRGSLGVFELHHMWLVTYQQDQPGTYPIYIYIYPNIIQYPNDESTICSNMLSSNCILINEPSSLRRETSLSTMLQLAKVKPKGEDLDKLRRWAFSYDMQNDHLRFASFCIHIVVCALE